MLRWRITWAEACASVATVYGTLSSSQYSRTVFATAASLALGIEGKRSCSASPTPRVLSKVRFRPL